ncbi:MAG: GNAT family N-acetyltransferase [Methylococcaceae bacterium]|nr:GNAT family N-acetyltransferase [Methylococcaceae bacterium]
MHISDFRVEPADYKADFEDLRLIRKAVFIVEQNIPEDIEFDVIDSNCYHVIARDNHHKPIGTARLSPDRKIGRMAVLENWRGKGVGKALITAILDKARKLGFIEVTLHAQTAVLNFYQKLGFTEEGKLFFEADIAHQLMRMPLVPAIPSRRPAPKPIEASIEITEVSTLQDILMASISLIQKSRKQICIYTPDLEPALYGHKDMVEALKQFAIGSEGGTVMTIVQDTIAVRNQPHPLLELAQRLPSIFLFRTPIEAEDMQYPSAFLINDREGYLFRQQGNKMLGVWSPTQPAKNRQLSDEFERVWQRSRPCSEFRALGL